MPAQSAQLSRLLNVTAPKLLLFLARQRHCCCTSTLTRESGLAILELFSIISSWHLFSALTPEVMAFISMGRRYLSPPPTRLRENASGRACVLLCLCGRWLGATGGRGQEKRDFSNAHPQTPAPLTATASHRHFPCARNVNPNTAFIHYKNLIFVWLLSLAVLINLNPTHAALRRCSCITSWWHAG